jgi:hypothetical protein
MTAAVGMIAGVGVANDRGHSCPMANPAKNSASERRTHGPRDDPLFLFGLVSARTVRLLLEGTLVSGKHSSPASRGGHPLVSRVRAVRRARDRVSPRHVAGAG